MPPPDRTTYPVLAKPAPACINHGPRAEELTQVSPPGGAWGASFHRQVQDLAESLPSYRLAPASPTRKTSLSEKTSPKHFALEEETRHKLQHVPPPPSLTLYSLELRLHICKKIVQQLAGKSFSKQKAENKTNNNNHNNNNTNDNNTPPTTTIQTTITTTTTMTTTKIVENLA